MPELNLKPKSLMGGLISADAQSRTVDNIKMLPLDKLDHFEDHPFNLYSKESLKGLSESIKEVGIIHPITVRPHEYGRYEILSGHNRTDAAKLAGLDEIPAKIVNVDDDQAMLIVVDANLKQRESLLYSEKALAIKKKYEAMINQGKADAVPNGHNYDEEDESCQTGTDINSGEAVNLIAADLKENRRNVYRYIKLSNSLCGEIFEILDNNEIPFRAAVDIADLNQEQQILLYEIISDGKYVVNLQNAAQLKANKDDLDSDKIKLILSGKTVEPEAVKKPKQPDQYKQVTKSMNSFLKAQAKQGYEFDPVEMETVVMAAINAYFEQRKAVAGRGL